MTRAAVPGSPRSWSKNTRPQESSSRARSRALIKRYRRSDAKSVGDFATEMSAAHPMEQVALERERLPRRVVAGLAEAMAVPRVRLFKMMALPRATIENKISTDAVLTGVANIRALNLLRLLAHARDILKDSTAPDAEGFDVARWLGRWIDA